MPPTGLNPATPASERPQTHAWDLAATGINFHSKCQPVNVVQGKTSLFSDRLKRNILCGRNAKLFYRSTWAARVAITRLLMVRLSNFLSIWASIVLSNRLYSVEIFIHDCSLRLVIQAAIFYTDWGFVMLVNLLKGLYSSTSPRIFQINFLFTRHCCPILFSSVCS
jgi:hypothetical protein